MKKEKAGGVLALMGSGELTASMVEVHKELLAGLPPPGEAVFLDTPAGFQLNADQITRRAQEYFRTRVGKPMTAASFKSSLIPDFEAEKAFQILRRAGFILIGPGSPTYAVRHWRSSPIPDILAQRVESGGCLVAASAAALTVGRSTLPVYEIYKVGEEPRWSEGLDLLGRFGFDLVIIPHWNNAEGGTHDTRYCYMGESRFRTLESQLSGTGVLGLDEHTACILDLKEDVARVMGIGRVTFRREGREVAFAKGERFPLGLLRERADRVLEPAEKSAPLEKPADSTAEESAFWDRVHEIESSFNSGMEAGNPGRITNALLDLDRAIWKAQQDLESEEFISQAREILREMIVLLGLRLESGPRDFKDCLSPVVEPLLKLRDEQRGRRKWKEADALRDILQQAGIDIEDTDEGPRWRLRSESKD